MATSKYFVVFTFTVLLTVLGIALTDSGSGHHQQLSSACKRKCVQPINGTETEKNCTGTGLDMQGRCCVNTTDNTVVGIDLEKCDLTREAFIEAITNLWHLEIISLEGNPISYLNASDFSNNTGIKYLSLPPKVECPGGNHAWEQIKSLPSAELCLGEVDICQKFNVSCPDDSHCSPSGVDASYCLCNHGYYGYKCMKEGNFPFVEFGIGLGAPTVVLCIFLWITQRRHVKTKPKGL